MQQGPFREIPRGDYSEVVLGFFDILGFSNLTRSQCQVDPNYLIDIFNKVDGYSRLNSAVEVRIVSDSIVLWSSNHELGLATIINAASMLQATLLQEGILIRGVIAKGPLYTTRVIERTIVDEKVKESLNPSDEVIVSPVLVRCVEQEKSLGEPIIKLDSSLLELFEITSKSIGWITDYTASYKDMTIVDGYFSSLEYRAIQHKTNYAESGPNSTIGLAKLHFSTGKKILEKVRNHILKQVNNNSPKTKSKWEFILVRYNQVILVSAQYFPELDGLRIRKRLFGNYK